MSNLFFGRKSPKGKPSNGSKPNGAMTNFKVQSKPEHGRGLSSGNHPTNARGK